MQGSRTELIEVRSKLFVPGSRPELFAKAFAGEADALSFDLEDSVTAGKKDEARRAVAQFIWGLGRHKKCIIVRVNPQGSDLFAADIAAVVSPAVHVINLPKVEAADDVLAAVRNIEAAEKYASMKTPVGILANIETPKGLRRAFEIATAHPRVVGLQIGFVDMAKACGFANPNVAALNTVRIAVRMAASETGIAAFDGAFVNVKDQEGFRLEAEEARSFGMDGKSCIHPSQISLANAVFAPSADAIETALRIVRAAGKAGDDGNGAFLLDGKMVDAPVVAQAQALLERANRYDLLQQSEFRS